MLSQKLYILSVIDRGLKHEKTVEQAKDDLLTKLYHARNKSTFGGYDAWLALLSMYYAFEYEAMYVYIQNCQGMGGKTRSECLDDLKIIMEGK